jgi:hypothetical protein
MASKKQITELENAVVLLEEKMEKMDDEHAMIKQMLSMQNALIENLQMMVKMMSVSQPQPTLPHMRLMHVGGDLESTDNSNISNNENGTETDNIQNFKTNNKSIKSMKLRMSRVA